MAIVSRFIPVFLVLVIGYLYWPALGHEYVWDDIILILETDALRNPENIWSSISQPILPGTSYFRPLVLLSFVGEFALFGVDPTISHLINILFHLINSVLVYCLAFRFLGHYRSVVAMAFYGFHPALVEPVVWVSGRFDVMVTTFMLIGLLGFVYLQGAKRVVVVCISFFLAALCKEMAVTLPLLVFILAMVEHNKTQEFTGKYISNKSLIVLLLWMVATGAFYLVIRAFGPAKLAHVEDYIVSSLSLLEYLAFIGLTIKFYVTHVLLPFLDLNPMHPLVPTDLSKVKVLTGLIWLTVSVALIGWLFYSRGRLGLWVLAGLASLAPVLNIVPLTIGGNIGHERFLVVPLVFIAVAVASIKIPTESLSANMKKSLPAITGVFLAGWLFIAIVNVSVTLPLWRDSLTLWGWAYAKYPDFDFVKGSYLSAAIATNRLDLAQSIVNNFDEDDNKSRKLVPIKGYFLVRVGRLDEAEKLLLGAIDGVIEPHAIYLQKGIDIEMVRIRNKSDNTSNFFRLVHGALSELFLFRGDFDKAIEEANITIFYQYDYMPPRLIKSLAYYGKGNLKQGDKFFEEVITRYDQSELQTAFKIKAEFIKQLCHHKAQAEANQICSKNANVTK